MQTLRGGADKEVVDAFEGRILALARENWDGVGLRNVIDQILQPFGLNDRRVARRFSVEGEDVRLQPKAALTYPGPIRSEAAEVWHTTGGMHHQIRLKGHALFI